MADTEDVNALKRRGRRRLVGAIALVLAAVIVLPMVFEDAPRQEPPRVSMRIPAENERPFAPQMEPKPAGSGAPAAPRGAGQAEVVPLPLPKVPSPQASGAPAEKAVPVTPSVGPAPSTPEPASSGTEFVVPVAALADAAKVKALTRRLRAAKIPHFTQPVSTAGGSVTRVRAGPFSSREAAEQAVVKIRRMGLTPGNPVPRAE